MTIWRRQIRSIYTTIAETFKKSFHFSGFHPTFACDETKFQNLLIEINKDLKILMGAKKLLFRIVRLITFAVPFCRVNIRNGTGTCTFHSWRSRRSTTTSSGWTTFFSTFSTLSGSRQRFTTTGHPWCWPRSFACNKTFVPLKWTSKYRKPQNIHGISTYRRMKTYSLKNLRLFLTFAFHALLHEAFSDYPSFLTLPSFISICNHSYCLSITTISSGVPEGGSFFSYFPMEVAIPYG